MRATGCGVYGWFSRSIQYILTANLRATITLASALCLRAASRRYSRRNSSSNRAAFCAASTSNVRPRNARLESVPGNWPPACRAETETPARASARRPIPPPAPRPDASSTAAPPDAARLPDAPPGPALPLVLASGPASPADRCGAAPSSLPTAIPPAPRDPPGSTVAASVAPPGSAPGAATGFFPACASPPASAGAATTAVHPGSPRWAPTAAENARRSATAKYAAHPAGRFSAAAPPIAGSAPHLQSTTPAPTPPACARTTAHCPPPPSPPAPPLPAGLDKTSAPLLSHAPIASPTSRPSRRRPWQSVGSPDENHIL